MGARCGARDGRWTKAGFRGFALPIRRGLILSITWLHQSCNGGREGRGKHRGPAVRPSPRSPCITFYGQDDDGRLS